VVVSVGAVVGLVLFGGMLNTWIDGGSRQVAQQPAGGAGDGRPPGGPPPPAVPVGGAKDRPTGAPQLVINQDSGDGVTVFVVHGRGWQPGTSIMIELAGRKSPTIPQADRAGTFNYAIDQGHVFFAGLIPVGSYTVVATGPGGPKAQVTFTVHP
jgi:hypothetical protein